MAEYKGKLLSGLFTRAQNCFMSDGKSVENAVNWTLLGTYTGGTNTTATIPSGAKELCVMMQKDAYFAFSFHLIVDGLGNTSYRNSYNDGSGTGIHTATLNISNGSINFANSGIMPQGGTFGGTIKVYYR